MSSKFVPPVPLGYKVARPELALYYTSGCIWHIIGIIVTKAHTQRGKILGKLLPPLVGTKSGKPDRSDWIPNPQVFVFLCPFKKNHFDNGKKKQTSREKNHLWCDMKTRPYQLEAAWCYLVSELLPGLPLYSIKST